MALRAGGDVSRQTLLENLDLDAEKEQDRLTEEQIPPVPPMPQGMEGMEGMGGIDPNMPLPEGMPLEV